MYGQVLGENIWKIFELTSFKPKPVAYSFFGKQSSTPGWGATFLFQVDPGSLFGMRFCHQHLTNENVLL